MKKQKRFMFDGDQPVVESKGTLSPVGDAAEEAYKIGQLLGRNALYRRPGLHVGRWFLSAELLVQTALLVAVVILITKTK